MLRTPLPFDRGIHIIVFFQPLYPSDVIITVYFLPWVRVRVGVSSMVEKDTIL